MARKEIKAQNQGNRFFLLSVNPMDVEKESILTITSDNDESTAREFVADKRVSGRFRKRIELTTYFRSEEGFGTKDYVSEHHLRHYGERLIALRETRTLVYSPEYIKIKNTLSGVGL